MVSINLEYEEPKVVITLSLEETAFLYKICDSIGGHRENSPRRHAENIVETLEKLDFAGFLQTYFNYRNSMETDGGSVYFHDYRKFIQQKD